MRNQLHPTNYIRYVVDSASANYWSLGDLIIFMSIMIRFIEYVSLNCVTHMHTSRLTQHENSLIYFLNQDALGAVLLCISWHD